MQPVAQLIQPVAQGILQKRARPTLYEELLLGRLMRPAIYSLVLLTTGAHGHSTAEVFKLCFWDVQCDSRFTSNTETAHFSYAQAQG
jgi:hypothetical protein